MFIRTNYYNKSLLIANQPRVPRRPWLWTNGVNTHGVAAKVINFDRLGKKVSTIDRLCQMLTDFDD